MSVITFSNIYGCASSGAVDETVCFNSQGNTVNCADVNTSPSILPLNVTNPKSEYITSTLQDQSLFYSKVNFQLLSEYVEQMAIKLKDSAGINIINSPIAVTSIVSLDSTLQNTNLLGNQIAEYFINELKNIGMQVSDHKVTGYIQITPSGDIAMSRNILELKQDLKFGNILTGTMIQNERGIIINCRIISLFDNKVVASTTKLIPNLIIQNY